jgi:ankyrin repeat protein
MVAYGVECMYKQMLSGVVTATRNWGDHAAETVLRNTLRAIHRFEQVAKKPGMFEDSTLKIHSTTLQRLISIYSLRDDNSEVEFLSRELINLPGLDISNSGIPEQRAEALRATSRRAGEILRDSIVNPAIKTQLNIDGTDPFPAFHRAIKAGHPDVVRIFLEMPTTTLDILEQYPLHIAAERGDTPALDAILLSDTTATAINSHDLLGRTPLCLAAFTGKLEIVKRLINAEGDPRLRDASARNSLHLACAGGRTDVVRFLLNWGLSPNDDTTIQPPPLHTAAAAGFHDICRLLLDHGAYTDDHDGGSAEEVARRSGHGEIAAMIKAAGKRPQNR